MKFAIAIAFLLTFGCAHAKPSRKPKSLPTTGSITLSNAVTIVPPVEKVSESEIARYKAAYYAFKALEYEILEKYRIRAEDGEVFDADTAVITRVRKAPTTPPAPPTKGGALMRAKIALAALLALIAPARAQIQNLAVAQGASGCIATNTCTKVFNRVSRLVYPSGCTLTQPAGTVSEADLSCAGSGGTVTSVTATAPPGTDPCSI